MEGQIKSRWTKIKTKRINTQCLHFKLVFAVIFQTLFLYSQEQKTIRLIIQGTGTQFCVSNDFSVTPSTITVNNNDGITSCSSTKTCNCEQDLNTVTVTFDDYLTTCEKMFYNLANIIEVDLSDLDTSKVTTMLWMFSICTNLKKITFGNINTTLVNNMYQLFFKCLSLTSIDLSNFDTSSVTEMMEMFSHCESLTSLNISTFNTQKVEVMYDMFGYCYELTSLDVSNLDTSKVTNMQGMFYTCKKLEYLDLSNFNISTATNIKSMFAESYSLKYLNITPFEIRNDADYDWILGNIPATLKICLIDKQSQLYLAPQIYNYNYDCSDNCFHKTYKYDLKDNICIEFCNLSEYRYEYNDFCYYRCPNSTYEPDDNEYFCLDKVAGDSYYFNTDKELFKKCHEKCKICEQSGDETTNNCLECKDGLIFLNEFTSKVNCYNECPHYYYFNELNQYLCTENEVCPENFNKFIPVYKKCIDECKKDRIYKYDYNNTCYDHCLSGTNETEDYICIKDESGETIVYQCSHDNNLMSVCSLNSNNNTEIYDIITTQILSDYSPDNNKSQIIEGVDNTIYQITTGKNELELLKNGDDSSNNYSLSIIDLGECESILKGAYNLDDDDSLIYLKKEKLSNKSSDKDIEFEVYEPYNKTKLNLSLCYTTDINIYVKLEMSSETEELNEQMKELGYNIFNINDPFYQDICTPFKSSGKTDMILSDRIDDIYNNDDAQCQPNCIFSGYLLGSNYINCSCNVNKNEEKTLVKEEKFKPKKLYESFFEVLKYSNYKILKCYKLIGNKRIITKNIGNIILIIFFVIYLISLIFYIIKGINPLKYDLEEIMIKEEEKKI